MTTCKRNRKEHLKQCNCTHCIDLGEELNHLKEPCPLRGKCCECIKHHRKKNELPACYFTEEQEKTFDRSIAFWWKQNGNCQCHSKDKATFITHIDGKEVQGGTNA